MDVSLPDEIIEIIMSFLEVKDVLQSRRVCKKWNEFALNEEIWHRLCKDDFGLETVWGDNWFETYQLRFV